MPIYEYRCDACGHGLEALQKVSDAPLTDCPECAADGLRRLISKPSFRLKGKGWYETDFKSEKEKKRNLAASSDDTSKPSADKPAKDKVKDASKTSGDGGSSKTSTKKDSGAATA